MGAGELSELKGWIARRFWGLVVALIGGAGAQVLSVVWWAATMDARMTAAERDIERLYATQPAAVAVAREGDETR